MIVLRFNHSTSAPSDIRSPRPSHVITHAALASWGGKRTFQTRRGRPSLDSTSTLMIVLRFNHSSSAPNDIRSHRPSHTPIHSALASLGRQADLPDPPRAPRPRLNINLDDCPSIQSFFIGPKRYPHPPTVAYTHTQRPSTPGAASGPSRPAASAKPSIQHQP